MHNKEQKWDEKARNYSRYSTDKNSFEMRLLEKIKAKDISFENKTILDVGAGTGVYTLHLAKEAKTVTAMDFSEQMLEVLKEDAKKENLENIFTCKSSWEDFTCKEKFDIAFSTMSPALDDSAGFAKFSTIANTKIYLGWAGIRDSNILNILFKAHGKVNQAPNGSNRLKKWLDSKHIPYMLEAIEELRVSTCKEEDGLEKYRWHLEIRGVEPDEEIIKNLLKNFTEDGIITETTTNHMNLIIW